MSILCILIGFIVWLCDHCNGNGAIHSVIMGIVTVGQVWNYNKWKRVR